MKDDDIFYLQEGEHNTVIKNKLTIRIIIIINIFCSILIILLILFAMRIEGG